MPLLFAAVGVSVAPSSVTVLASGEVEEGDFPTPLPDEPSGTAAPTASGAVAAEQDLLLLLPLLPLLLLLLLLRLVRFFLRADQEGGAMCAAVSRG